MYLITGTGLQVFLTGALVCAAAAATFGYPEGSVLIESETARGEWDAGSPRAELAPGGLSGGGALHASQGWGLSVPTNPTSGLIVDLPEGRYVVWVRSYIDGEYPGLHAYNLTVGGTDRAVATCRAANGGWIPFAGYRWEKWGACDGGRIPVRFWNPNHMASCSDCLLFTPDDGFDPARTGESIELMSATCDGEPNRDGIQATVRFRVVTPIPEKATVTLALCTAEGSLVDRRDLPLPDDRRSPGSIIELQSIDFAPTRLYSGRHLRLMAKVGDFEILGSEGGDGTLCVIDLPAAASPGLPRCAVKRINGVMRIVVDGKPITELAYQQAMGDDKCKWEAYDAGIRLFRLPAGLGDCAEGPINTGAIDRQFASFFERAPEAYALLHLAVDAPLWWMAKHPDELCLYDSGKSGPQSLASERWRRDTGDALRAFIRHISKAPYADRIIGFALAAGFTTEWQSWGLWDNERGDFSAPNLTGYRNWLARNLTPADVESVLGKGITAANATIPKRSQREKPTDELFQTDPAVALYYQYYSEPVADSILHFAKIAKEESNNRLVVGAYYGYQCIYGGLTQESQHLAAERVSNSDYLDFMCSPASYVTRGCGGTSTFMSCADSIQMRGKLWFNESDNSTYLTGKDDRLAPGSFPENREQSIAILQREFGHVISRGAANWYFDMSGGWYSDPEILSLFGKMVDYRSDVLADKRAPAFEPEIAFLVDESNFYFMTPGSAFLNTSYAFVFSKLPTIGATYGVYWLSDAHRLPTSVKLVIIVNAYRLDATQMRVLSTLGRPGRSVLWMYAPGLYTAEPFVLGARIPEQMSKLTGIDIRIDDTALPLSATATLPDGAQEAFEAGSGRPAVWCSDGAVSTIATYNDTDRCALGVKDRGGWLSMWSGVPTVPVPVLRELARRAGVHIFCDSGDTFYAGHGTITVHSNHAGPKRISLPGRFSVEEIFTEAPLKITGASAIEFEMKSCETRTFRVRRGE